MINSKYDRDLMGKMLKAIKHRGPDGEGIMLMSDGQVLFGHVRLSIIDLSKYASQPMHSINGRYSITYNGELYNYKALRRNWN